MSQNYLIYWILICVSYLFLREKLPQDLAPWESKHVLSRRLRVRLGEWLSSQSNSSRLRLWPVSSKLAYGWGIHFHAHQWFTGICFLLAGDLYFSLFGHFYRLPEKKEREREAERRRELKTGPWCLKLFAL